MIIVIILMLPLVVMAEPLCSELPHCSLISILQACSLMSVTVSHVTCIHYTSNNHM